MDCLFSLKISVHYHIATLVCFKKHIKTDAMQVCKQDHNDDQTANFLRISEEVFLFAFVFIIKNRTRENRYVKIEICIHIISFLRSLVLRTLCTQKYRSSAIDILCITFVERKSMMADGKSLSQYFLYTKALKSLSIYLLILHDTISS